MIKRVGNLDVLKLYCAFLVVCIHAPFSWDRGYVAAVSEVAVPVFFMISGFFYEGVRERGRERQQINKILKLIIVSNVFYFLWHLFIYGISGGAGAYIGSVINAKAVVEFLVFNESAFSLHLWYLGSFLYVLIVVGILNNGGVLNKIYWMIPILLLMDLILGKYSLLIWKKDLYYLYSRNFLFVALPYFLLGHLVDEKKESIRSFFGTKRKKLLLPTFAVFFTLTTLAARYCLIYSGLNASREHYLSTTALAVLLLLIAITWRSRQEENLLANLGRNNATFIYIIHPFIKDAVALIVPGSLNGIYLAVRPVIVFGVSLLISITYNKLVCGLRLKKYQ